MIIRGTELAVKAAHRMVNSTKHTRSGVRYGEMLRIEKKKLKRKNAENE